MAMLGQFGAGLPMNLIENSCKLSRSGHICTKTLLDDKNVPIRKENEIYGIF
jgi:hypothetical protein